MPKAKTTDVPHSVNIIYSKGDDSLRFDSKAHADAAVKKLLEDVDENPHGIITVNDDAGKTINFKAHNFVRTIAKPAPQSLLDDLL